MSLNVAHMAVPLLISRRWALPWHLYRGLLRCSATGPVLPRETPFSARVAVGAAGSDARAVAAPVAGPAVDRFKAARYAAPASFSSGIFIKHIHRTCLSDMGTDDPCETFSTRQLLRDLVPVRTVRNFPADHLGYLWNECDEWAQDVSVYGRSSRLGRGCGKLSRRLPDLVPHFVPPSSGFRRERNHSRCRVCVCQPL